MLATVFLQTRKKSQNEPKSNDMVRKQLELTVTKTNTLLNFPVVNSKRGLAERFDNGWKSLLMDEAFSLLTPLIRKQMQEIMELQENLTKRPLSSSLTYLAWSA